MLTILPTYAQTNAQMDNGDIFRQIQLLEENVWTFVLKIITRILVQIIASLHVLMIFLLKMTTILVWSIVHMTSLWTFKIINVLFSLLLPFLFFCCVVALHVLDVLFQW